MREIGKFVFPEPGNREECDAWRPYVRYRALAGRVLVVAKTRIEGAWAAYCDAVPGQNHDREHEEVLRHGSKLLEEWARPLFPELEGVPYAH